MIKQVSTNTGNILQQKRGSADPFFYVLNIYYEILEILFRRYQRN